MIHAKRMNAAALMVRDLERSRQWYRDHFGFELLYEVEGGILIGRDGVEIVLAQAADPDAPAADPGSQICLHTIGFEVSAADLAQVKKEFPEDDDIVPINHPRFSSFIIEDPDGHCLELFTEKENR